MDYQIDEVVLDVRSRLQQMTSHCADVGKCTKKVFTHYTWEAIHFLATAM